MELEQWQARADGVELLDAAQREEMTARLTERGAAATRAQQAWEQARQRWQLGEEAEQARRHSASAEEAWRQACEREAQAEPELERLRRDEPAQRLQPPWREAGLAREEQQRLAQAILAQQQRRRELEREWQAGHWLALSHARRLEQTLRQRLDAQQAELDAQEAAAERLRHHARLGELLERWSAGFAQARGLEQQREAAPRSWRRRTNRSGATRKRWPSIPRTASARSGCRLKPTLPCSRRKRRRKRRWMAAAWPIGANNGGRRCNSAKPCTG